MNPEPLREELEQRIATLKAQIATRDATIVELRRQLAEARAVVEAFDENWLDVDRLSVKPEAEAKMLQWLREREYTRQSRAREEA